MFVPLLSILNGKDIMVYPDLTKDYSCYHYTFLYQVLCTVTFHRRCLVSYYTCQHMQCLKFKCIRQSDWTPGKTTYHKIRRSLGATRTALGIVQTLKTAMLTLSMSNYCTLCMMTSSNGNIFRVKSPLCGDFTGDRWILSTKASDAELWCFLWSAPE